MRDAGVKILFSFCFIDMRTIDLQNVLYWQWWHGIQHPSLKIESLIELVDVLATTGGSELALTGGDWQVIKADHLAWHQLDTPVQWNIIKVFLCKLTCSWCMALQSAAAARWSQSLLTLPSSHTPQCKPSSTSIRCSCRESQQRSQAPSRFLAQ